jgi:tetratricopeptide (TPR) repeat protein
LKAFATIFVLVSLPNGFAQGQGATLSAKAKADFEKADSEPIPTIVSTLACVQSNAAALPVVRPDERYVTYYQKGYCELFSAISSGSSDSFQAAARDFSETIANWPKKFTSPPPGGLRALIAISHIEQGRMVDSYPDTARDLAAVVAERSCAPTPVIGARFCNSLIDTARTWLGWLSYQKNDFEEAARVFEPLAQANPPRPWMLWVSALQAEREKHLELAAALYEKTLAVWSAAENSPAPDTVTLLGPKLDAASIHFQLALTDYARQRYDPAITQLDAAIKGSPKNSYAIFLRARSKEALHLDIAAMEDYVLAAKTARANNESGWNVGLASYYRGLLLYRAKDYSHAEAEFSNALSGKLGEVPQPDVTAWWRLAGISARGCDGPLDPLESALKAASNQFPKAQANAILFGCRMKQSTTVEQDVALEKAYASQLDPEMLKALRGRIASAYTDRGVAAEDRKDPYEAAIAYRQAIEWNPAVTKARFNLGAIYIGDKRYQLAEAEFLALVKADPGDYEAHYWLAQSILAQHPGPDRSMVACGLLQRSLAIQDPQRKKEFAKALAAAKCARSDLAP